MKVDGKSRRGRPEKNWMQCIAEDMKTRGVTIEDAQDRKNWRKMTQIADPTAAGTQRNQMEKKKIHYVQPV